MKKPEDSKFFNKEKGRVDRNYENVPMVYNDLTKLVYQLAVFDTVDEIIYKLNVIDYPGGRFETSGDRKSRWISFRDGILFNFMTEGEFEYFYNLYSLRYKRPRTKEYILDWLKHSVNRIGLMTHLKPEEDPVDTRLSGDKSEGK